MSLDTPTPSGPPSAYFPSEGDQIVVGVVNVHEYQQRDYDTGEPKTWPDGGKVMGKCVTGLVVSTEGTTAKGSQRSSEPVNPGDVVTFWCEGGKYYTYRDALKAAGGIDVGDVMLWKRVDDKPPSNPRHNPAKQYVAKIRKPKPEDGDLVERCKAAHREATAQRVDATPEPATAGGPFDGRDDLGEF